MRYILLIILLNFTSILHANTEENSCTYKAGYIAHKQITEKNINFYKWVDRISKDNGEYITTLYITYDNGNTVTIEHKYCDMYNFEVSYFVADPDFSYSKENISGIMTQYFELYSVKKLSFTPTLDMILKNNLKDFKYSGNERVELIIEQHPLTSAGTYRRLINFYIGIGGMG